MNYNEATIEKLITNVGMDRLANALPQNQVRKALDLVSVHDLAQTLGLSYSAFRWHMGTGRIPAPQHRLVRRAYYTTHEAEAIAKAWAEN
jgi:hypothetical protein